MVLTDLMTVPLGVLFELDTEHMKTTPWFQNILTSSLIGPKSALVNYPKKIWAKVTSPHPNRRTISLSFPAIQGSDLLRSFYVSGATTSLPIKGKTVAKVPAEFSLFGLTHSIGTSGWDPEIFVEDGLGTMIPAFNFLPSKDKGIATGMGTAYYDGFQAEFTTKPDNCHGYGIDYLRAGLQTVLQQARKYNPKAKLSLKSVYRIPEPILASASDDHVALGCKPSKNAYGNPPFQPEDCRMLPYRVAGGHIHFASLFNTDEEVVKAVKAMDIFLAIPCVAIFDGVDDPLRREFYGRAGEFRRPKYGVEYRTLSNAWLCDPKLCHGIMDMARRAKAAASYAGDLAALLGEKEEHIQEIINYCDVKAARAFMKKHLAAFKAVMSGYFTGPKAVAYEEIIFGGVGEGFPDYANIDDNWHLTKGAWGTHSNGMIASFGQHSQQSKYTKVSNARL